MTQEHPIRGDVAASTRDRNIFLDGLRGISALVVVFFHLSSCRLPLHGYLAVDFFFMLSGFVIAGAYEDKLKAGGRPSWFFGVRMARLYPLAIFGLVVGLACALITKPGDPLAEASEFARGVIFIPTLGGGPDGSAYGLNPALWSLVAELGVNMLYAWGGWKLCNRALVCVMVISGAAMIPPTLINGWNNLGANSTWVDFIGAVARVLFAFPFGVLLLRLKRSGWRPRTTLSVPMLVLLLLVVYAVPTHLVVPVDVILADAVLPLLFVLMLGAAPPHGLTTIAFTWMGRISYALYAVHNPIVVAVHPVNRQPTLTEAAIALLLVALVGLFGHLVVEPWGKKLISSLFLDKTREWKVYPL